MKLLAIDTGTAELSIAVCRPEGGESRVWQHSAPGGAQASAHLIPAVMALLREADLLLKDLDAIAFGAGPGSFTGLRTACAVAQGLGFGTGVPLLPVDSLLAVAEDARHTLNEVGPLDVFAVLDARMDEVYAARYIWDGACWSAGGDWVVCKPEMLAAGESMEGAGWLVAGNAFEAFGERLLPGWPRQDARPTAGALLRLAPALLAAGQAVPAAQALPRYIRDKVAQTTAERLAIKAMQSAGPAGAAG